jgi:hypothetical protein
MTHNELKEKLLKAMGGKPAYSARPTWAEFIRGEGTSFFINYDWIQVPAFYEWLSNAQDVQFDDGAQGLFIWIDN